MVSVLTFTDARRRKRFNVGQVLVINAPPAELSLAPSARRHFKMTASSEACTDPSPMVTPSAIHGVAAHTNIESKF